MVYACRNTPQSCIGFECFKSANETAKPAHSRDPRGHEAAGADEVRVLLDVFQ